MSPVLGVRGRWLAARRPDWITALGPALAASALTDEATTDPAESAVWTHGTSGERQAWFAALRASVPAAATALLLGSDWRRERGDDRLAFVQALRDGLSAADEPVLELARGDRRQDVRIAAADLLADLPGSAYAAHLAAAALACLRVERRRARRTLVVTFPDPEVGEFAEATSAPAASAGTAGGPAARLLHWLLVRTPLTLWEHSLAATPAELVAMPVADGLDDHVHTAWAAAAVRQHNATWAVALEPIMKLEELPPLLAAMPSSRRAAVVARVIDDESVGQGHQRDPVIMALLQQVQPPWPDELTAAIVRWLAGRSATAVPWQARGIVDLAGASLRPDRITAARVASAAGRHPEGSPWRPVIHRLADVLLYRHTMLEELR